jgi:hypothetical protein
MSFRVEEAGRFALRALQAGPATVFAKFERSCYVETAGGIACLGGLNLGLGPLNAVIPGFDPEGSFLDLETKTASTWVPTSPGSFRDLPEVALPDSIGREAEAFLLWLRKSGPVPDSLIGRGPGLTPAGDDFVGGAMIALRAFGHAEEADRIAAWALPLAEKNTSRISRAHLACAAAGEGHEALHDLLTFADVERDLARLARIGHTSGTDAAAGALGALRCFVTDRLQKD